MPPESPPVSHGLPPRPGIKRKADVCPRCHCLHLNAGEVARCREVQYEQKS